MNMSSGFDAPIRKSDLPLVSHLRRGGFRASALYRLFLLGPTPKGMRFDVPVVWPGDPHIGKAILAASFTHLGETHIVSSPRDLPQQASIAWLSWFHGHGWLKDLSALNDDQAPAFARQWISAWIDANRTWGPISWRPEVSAQRLINWCQHWSFLLHEEDRGPFERALRQTIGRDARHLLRTIPARKTGFVRLRALKGQAFGVFAILGGEGRMTRTLARLEKEIGAQILPDGGHIERNPECLTLVLQDLLELKSMLRVATGDVPGFIQNAIDRAAPMVRALRHADGGLALFNSGLKNDPAALDLLLAQTDSSAKPPLNAPHAGFQRLSAGAVHLIVDAGKPTAFGCAQHAGTLSFEMSAGKHRMIVNCGARTGPSDPWRSALAATAAHSTLTVDDTSSSVFDLDGELHSGPQNVTCTRRDVDQGTLVETSHDGYLSAFGLIHHRALYLASHGADLRGEDRLTGTGGHTFAIRFHLHPTVKASVLGDGHGVLLRLPNKEIWRLRTSGNTVKLEESVYLSQPGELRRAEQIVISGPLSGNGALVKWALSRDGS